MLLKAPEALKYILACAGACLAVALGLLIHAAAHFARQHDTRRLSRFVGLILHPPRLIDELYIGPPGPEPPTAHARRIRKCFELALALCFLAILIAAPMLKIVDWINRH